MRDTVEMVEDFGRAAQGMTAAAFAREIAMDLVLLKRQGWSAERIARFLTEGGYKVSTWTVKVVMLPAALESDALDEEEVNRRIERVRQERTRNVTNALMAKLGVKFASPESRERRAEVVREAVREAVREVAEERRVEERPAPRVVERSSPVTAGPVMDEAEAARRRRAAMAEPEPEKKVSEESVRERTARREKLGGAEIALLAKLDNLPLEVIWWLERADMSCGREEAEWRTLFDVPRMAKRPPAGFDTFEMAMMGMCRRKQLKQPAWMKLCLMRDSDGQRKSLDAALAEMGFESFDAFAEAARGESGKF